MPGIPRPQIKDLKSKIKNSLRFSRVAIGDASWLHSRREDFEYGEQSRNQTWGQDNRTEDDRQGRRRQERQGADPLAQGAVGRRRREQRFIRRLADGEPSAFAAADEAWSRRRRATQVTWRIAWQRKFEAPRPQAIRRRPKTAATPAERLGRGRSGTTPAKRSSSAAGRPGRTRRRAAPAPPGTISSRHRSRFTAPIPSPAPAP
jgi:hypothetical protein